jgi:peroxiredoxin
MFTHHGKRLLSFLLLSVFWLTACSNDLVSTEAIDSAAGYSDVDGVNLVVGKPAPDFSLSDSRGNSVTLSIYQGKSNVMLIFYRGYWCPFCIGHLDEIQSLFPELEKYNIQLLGISPDNAEDSQDLAERFDQPYVFLSDTGLKITDLYGVRKDEELPHPAVVLIDKQGDVVWFYVGENYKQRPSSSQLEKVFKRVF